MSCPYKNQYVDETGDVITRTVRFVDETDDARTPDARVSSTKDLSNSITLVGYNQRVISEFIGVVTVGGSGKGAAILLMKTFYAGVRVGLTALGLGLMSVVASGKAWAQGPITVVRPTTTAAGSINIQSDISFPVTTSGNLAAIVFDAWVTNDTTMSTIPITGQIQYTLGGTAASLTANEFIDNFAEDSNDITANDGYIFSNGRAAVTAGQTFVLKSGTYVLPADAAAAQFNAGANQTFRGKVFLTDDNATKLSSDVQLAAAATAPTVTTPTSASITPTGATLGGNVESDGGSPLIEQGVVYAPTSVNPDPLVGGAGVSRNSRNMATTGVFTRDIAFLSPNTQYSFRAYATNASGTSYSPVATFTTAVAPVISINDLALSEGNAGTTAFTFTVIRSANTSGTTSVDYVTSNGSATTASGDYASASGTLTFNANDATRTFTVLVSGDTALEADETFTVTLSNATGGATLAKATATGFITNDDFETPSLVVDTVSDTVSKTDNLTSLREAILLANTATDPVFVAFDEDVFAGARQTITLNSPLPTVTGSFGISGPSAGVVVTGRVGPSNALFSVGAGGSVGVARLFFVGSKTGVRNGGTFFLALGGLSSSTTNLENNGTANLVFCTVEGSSTGIANSGILTVDTSRFAGNTNALVNAADRTATVKSSTFEGNAVGAVNNGAMTLSNSTLSGNGDAVRNQSGNATVIQSTLVGNTNAVVNSQNATLRLLRATVAGNGGGLNTGGGTVELRSTLLVGNGTNLTGTPTSGGSNLVNVTAPVAGLEVDGNGFPLLKPNGGPTATVALLAGSRAINAGESGIKTGNDQRGGEFPRVVNGRADIGAFEFQTPNATQTLKDAAPSGGTS